MRNIKILLTFRGGSWQRVSNFKGYVQIVGQSGEGKSTLSAAMIKYPVVSDGYVKSKTKWKKDIPSKMIIDNPNGNFPTMDRRPITGKWLVKGPSNMHYLKFGELTLLDDRGGKFQRWMDYDYDYLNRDQWKQLFSKDFARAQAVIEVFSAESIINACPSFNPMICTGQKKLKCKMSENYKNCLIRNPYSVKRVLQAVADLTNDQEIPVSIAITHCDRKSKEELTRVKNVLDLYLQDIYGDSFSKPNYFFLDSIAALKNKKSEWAKKARLPLCDVLYKLIDKLEVKSQNLLSKFAFGDFAELKRLTKDSLLTQVEYYGGFY